ncbi:MAG: sialidase family protein [Candidatus Paceibacterota bacterium]
MIIFRLTNFALLPLIIVTLITQACMAQFLGDVKKVVTIDTLDRSSVYKQVWQPYIAEWDEDHYVVAYGQKLKGKSDLGNIVTSISMDGGKTWMSPITIFDHTLPDGRQRYAYANPVLFKPDGQDIIWCFVMRAPLHYPDSEDSKLAAAYSSDGGLSWKQVELSVHFGSPLITNAGIVPVEEDGVTKYLLPVHRNTKRHDPKGDAEQFVLESTNLLSWHLAGYIPRPDSVWVHEGNIAEGANPDELKIVMRTAEYYEWKTALDVPRAYSSVSTDVGKTWTKAKMEPDLWNTASKGTYEKDSKGRHIYIYNDGPRGERKRLYYKIKEPGKEWSEARLFYWANNRNSYATLLEKEPGVFLSVWDSSNQINRKRTVIRFGILNLNEL